MVCAPTSLPPAVPAPLEGGFATPPSPDGIVPTPATQRLVASQVDALLAAAPSYHNLSGSDRDALRRGMVRIASYAAECLRDMCWQSNTLGQTPVVRRKTTFARAQTSNFRPSAASQVARVTRETLRAVAFPTFVADLIRGTFNAVVQTSIQQMESFVQMIANVSKTVDQFMADNISDFQARDWLAARYPEHIRIHEGMATVREGTEDRPAPSFARDLNLPGEISLDDSTIEETLVPAARRRLAETRLQMLSTLVLMGVNRIVITGGKIRATMGFHIDTTDRAHEEEASDFDFRTAAAGSFGFGPWSASASLSISYVRSTRATSDAELNVDADLTGEVELHFKSDYFPVERFANQATLGAIRGNTAAPEANPLPPSTTPPDPLGSGVPEAGGTVGRYTSSRSRRRQPAAPSLPPIGSPRPEQRRPDEPDPVRRRPEPPMPPESASPSPTPETPPGGPPAGEHSEQPNPADSGSPTPVSPGEQAPASDSPPAQTPAAQPPAAGPDTNLPPTPPGPSSTPPRRSGGRQSVGQPSGARPPPA
jgi:hypothetical protein